MTQPVTKLQFTAMSLVVGGVAACTLATIVNARQLGWWQLLVYLGAAAALVGVYWFRRKLTVEEAEIEVRRRHVESEHSRITEEEQRLEEMRRTIQQEMGEQASRLDHREQRLATRLAAYHEWLEFPAPVDLQTELAEVPASDTELAELVRKDRRLNELLADETRILFEHIKSNRYAAAGEFQLPLLRDDLHTLVTKVACIYQPGVEHPLLETSLERVLRSRGTSLPAVPRGARRFADLREGLQPQQPLRVHSPGGEGLWGLQVGPSRTGATPTQRITSAASRWE